MIDEEDEESKTLDHGENIVDSSMDWSLDFRNQSMWEYNKEDKKNWSMISNGWKSV